MKKIFFFIFLSFCLNFYVFGQTQEKKIEAEEIVQIGIALHDKGNYEGALEKYDEALTIDPENLMALAEKAITLFTMQQYEEAVIYCKKSIDLHSHSELLKAVYVVYGNALDMLKKPEEAIKAYDIGIKDFPTFYQLHFNKGITLSGLGKLDEALLCFNESATLNPKHASSHNAIARILDKKKNRIPSIMAYSRFIILEPESKRTSGNYENLMRLMNGNVKKTGKKSVTINIGSDLLNDTTADGKVRENSFTTTDLILAMSAGLNLSKEKKKKSEIDLFIDQFSTMCSSLKETQKNNHGFYWDYYATYFIKMSDENLIEPFAYIIFAHTADKNVLKWIEKNKNKISSLYQWSNNFEWK